LSIDIYLEKAKSIHQRESQLLYLTFALLCLIAIAIAIAPAARVGSWDDASQSFQHLIVLPVWVLGTYLIRKSLQDRFVKRDPFLLPIPLCLAGWGMLILWRIDPVFGARQTGWFLVASLGLLAILRAPADLKWLRQYRYLWLLGGIFLILMTLVFGTNPSGGEPRLWLGCCGVYFQPSEPLRLLLVAFLASYFADRLAFKWVEQQPSIVPMLGPLLIVWFVSILLLFVQRDLGTGTLFLALLATLLFIATNRWQALLVACGLGIVGGIVGYTFIQVIQTRLQAWINPWADPIGGSYQLVQSLIAIASGGILGRGPGMGSPGFVPAAHTDFIFTALSEEWGLIGAVALLAFFAIFVSRGIKIALHLHDPFDKMLASGLSLAFGLQAILIIGGVMRLLPLTGITLPFVSYGGSSLLTSFLALGLLLQLSNRTSSTPNDLRSLRPVVIGLNIGWVMLTLAVGWWSVFRSEELTSRTDNPRRAYVERFEERGRILDRQNTVLSESVGSVGNYRRTYYFPSFSSIIGYNSPLYGLSDLEESMDLTLRGEAVYHPFDIAWSNILQSHPPPGLDIRLTLDTKIQNATYEILGERPGAVVVFQPSSGDILALVSSPSFNSETINQDWEELTTRTDAPLLNRVTKSQYQPGMTMAPFLIAWGLEHNLIDLSQDVLGAANPIDIHGEILECSSSPPLTESMNIALALKLGCPSYFAEFGGQLSGEEYQEIVHAFRLDETPSLRIESVQPDALAIPTNLEEMKFAALGQASLTVMPIQIARAFGALVNDGVLPSLRLVDAIESPDGGWDRIPSLDSPQTIITTETGEAVLASSRSSGEDIHGFSFQAIVGPEQERLHWFLGVDSNGRAIVVVLEGESLKITEEIGTSILSDMSSLFLP
jgi:cell division protein FtsW (lipid II flippase)